MNELPIMTINSATEQAELRTVLIAMAQGKRLYQACAEVGITTITARRRMAQYPEVLSDFKKANDAIMRSQLLNIVEARNAVIDKIVGVVEKTEDADTLMRLNAHLNLEADRIQAALNTDGSSRDDEVKRVILGIQRKPQQSRMEININLNGERIDNNPPPIIIDAKAE
jgi:hypothetical protein